VGIHIGVSLLNFRIAMCYSIRVYVYGLKCIGFKSLDVHHLDSFFPLSVCGLAGYNKMKNLSKKLQVLIIVISL
jgi:hypothetical protein